MTNRLKMCQLEECKVCDNCCGCDSCELTPDKVCDNCARCLHEADYSGIDIDILIDGDEIFKLKKKFCGY